jgi:hypothetical protein
MCRETAKEQKIMREKLSEHDQLVLRNFCVVFANTLEDYGGFTDRGIEEARWFMELALKGKEVPELPEHLVQYVESSVKTELARRGILPMDTKLLRRCFV